MLENVKKSLEESPIVQKGEYHYFVNPISDGVPAMTPDILNELTETIMKHVDLDIDKIVAVEAMGIHLATALSLATGIPFVIIRKRQYGLAGEKEIEQKTGYGFSKLYVNDLKEGDKIVLIDDVVSTGGTLTSTINTLKDMGIEVETAIAVINKGNGKKIVEEQIDIPIFSIVDLDVVDGKVVIESTVED